MVVFWAKAEMDRSADGIFTGADSIKNRAESCNLKYKIPLQPYQKRWYYFGLLKPKYAERFPFSTSLFVFSTDYWHRCQFIVLNGYIAATALLTPWAIYAFVGIRLIYAIIFNFRYER